MSIGRNPIAGEPIAVASAEPKSKPGGPIIIVRRDRVTTPSRR